MIKILTFLVFVSAVICSTENDGAATINNEKSLIVSSLLKPEINDDSENVRMRRSMSRGSSGKNYVFGNVIVYIRRTCRSYRYYRPYNIQLPVARQNRDDFKFSGSWTRYSGSPSIYVHSYSRDTLIIDGSRVFIVPAILNDDDQIFSIGYLIGSGFASFYRSNYDYSRSSAIADHFHFGDHQKPGMPKFDVRNGRFKGPFVSYIDSQFRPPCRPSYEDDDDGYENDGYSNYGYGRGYDSESEETTTESNEETSTYPSMESTDSFDTTDSPSTDHDCDDSTSESTDSSSASTDSSSASTDSSSASTDSSSPSTDSSSASTDSSSASTADLQLL